LRDKILAGFKDIAYEFGFHRATINELSARTGISKRTIYRYFRSKDEMVAAVMDQIMEKVIEKTDKHINKENPIEAISGFINAITGSLQVISPLMIYDLQKRYPEIWQNIEDFRSKRLKKIINNILKNNQGHFRAIIPEVFIAAALSSTKEVINPNFILKHNLTIEQAINSLFEILFYGVIEKDK
jgi:TetR/AcrR family transcriptional regulator